MRCGTGKKKKEEALKRTVTPASVNRDRNGGQRNVVKSCHSPLFIFPSRIIFLWICGPLKCCAISKRSDVDKHNHDEFVSPPHHTLITPLYHHSFHGFHDASLLPKMTFDVNKKCKYKDPVNPHVRINRVASEGRSYLKSSRINTATASSTRDTL